MIIVRNDDFDPRWSLDIVKKFHEFFMERNMVETLSIQMARGYTIGFKEDVVNYIKNTPNYDLALHGWEHERYENVLCKDIVRDLAASLYFFKRIFDVTPEYFYSPWNIQNVEVLKACQILGLKVRENPVDIKAYINRPEVREKADSVYFHMWEKDHDILVPKLLDIIKEEQNGPVQPPKTKNDIVL